MRMSLRQPLPRAMSMAKALLAAAIFMFGACSHHGGDIDRMLAGAGNTKPRPERFRICYANGCKKKAEVSLTPQQWAQIRTVFEGTAGPEDERRRLRTAIALLERWSGEQTGTHRDVGGSFQGFGLQGQMDCIDEMVNTATYIRMMERDGLLAHHRLHSYEYLGFFETSIWPHAGVGIRETETDRRFVVDSWWLDNGAPPYVVTYGDWWKGGWRKRYEAMDRAAFRQTAPPAP